MEALKSGHGFLCGTEITLSGSSFIILRCSCAISEFSAFYLKSFLVGLGTENETYRQIVSDSSPLVLFKCQNNLV